LFDIITDRKLLDRRQTMVQRRPGIHGRYLTGAIVVAETIRFR